MKTFIKFLIIILINISFLFIIHSENTSQILAFNKAQKKIIIKNPNTMNVKTTPRDAKTLGQERELIEKGAEEIMKFAVKNGIDAMVQEINKGKNGLFKKYLSREHNYFSSNKKINNVWTIIASANDEMFIGFEVDKDEFIDITGWKYTRDFIDNFKNSNCIWVENIFWQDPDWSNSNPCRMSSYIRKFQINQTEYWIYMTLWLEK